jgi:hypothetical protein
LIEAKQTTLNTTQILQNSLQQLNQATEIGNHAIITINMDSSIIENTNNNLDNIQSESNIAIRLLTRFAKNIYTDKLIIMFVLIIVCAIAIILLYKYKIIRH